MKSAPRMQGEAGATRAREAWSAFWQEPGQSRCAAGAPQIWQPLARHWAAFSHALPSRTRVLDLGCGAGAVARLLLAERADLQVTGVDFARLPLVLRSNVELLSETGMESLPFTAQSFGAAVSQFGFEYGVATLVTRELARVLSPGARISLLVHHAGSDIVATNSIRLRVLETFLGTALRTAFCTGDAAALHAQLASLASRHPADTLAVELARALPSRLERSPRERLAIWKAIEDALAPERCLAEALDASCVPESRLDDWLGPLRAVCELQAVQPLREEDGAPIAWRIEGLLRDA